jgi:hypothetical protein
MSHAIVKSASLAVLLLAMQTGFAAAQDTASTRLRAFDEVPALSSPGTGTFEAEITGNQINYTLTYNNLTANITQAHIHFAQRGVNGGIVFFLCTNLGNGPAGTPNCPGTRSGTVSGNINSGRITGGAADQGIQAGQMAKVLKAIRGEIAYANVHTTNFPSGEIRGQVVFTPGP